MLIIDRFEENWAIIEDEATLVKIPRSWLPEACQEGDVLKLELLVDLEATEERRQKAEARMKKLFKE